MNQEDIKRLVTISKKVNLNEISSENDVIVNNIRFVYEFIQNLELNYADLIKKLTTTNIRFCDYYDATNFHGQQIIEYFSETYKGEDKEEMQEVFSLYVALKNITELVYNYDLCDTLEELYEILDYNNYFNDMMYVINYINDKKMLKDSEQKAQMDFLNNDNKYKILFTGFSQKDIEKLEKNVKKSFINKISGELSKSDVVTLAECIDHVKGLYDLPIFRIHLAGDYRIAYIRRNGVTAILGVTLKTGKESDYTRYDHIAKNKQDIYDEIDKFSKGELDSNAQHYQVLEDLKQFNEKTR